MDAITYKIIHLTGVAAVAIGLGGAFASGKSKLSSAILGVGLLVMLVSGFGMLAKNHMGYPHFAIVKTILWVVIGMLPFLFRKFKLPPLVGILIAIALIGVMAWLGVKQPALW